MDEHGSTKGADTAHTGIFVSVTSTWGTRLGKLVVYQTSIITGTSKCRELQDGTVCFLMTAELQSGLDGGNWNQFFFLGGGGGGIFTMTDTSTIKPVVYLD